MKHLLIAIAALAVIVAGYGTLVTDPGMEPEPHGNHPGVDEREERRQPGRWRPWRPDEAGLTREQREEIDRLHALGYVAGSVAARAESGVVIHDPDRSYPGLNLYTSGDASGAVLMDMDGRVLHRWQYAFRDAFPDFPRDVDRPDFYFWRRARLLPNGDIVAIHEGFGILKLDKDSNLLWARPHHVHHDLQLRPNGEIYVLTRTAHVVPRVHPERPVLEDFVSILDADGNEKRRISLLESFENAEPDHEWRAASSRFWRVERTRRLAYPQGDLFHTNSLRVLDGRGADRVPAFAEGNLLVSMCHLDGIAVVDPDANEVVWSMLGSFGLQHDPTMTPDGQIVLFDNHWRPKTRSSATILDPLTGETRWQFTGTDEDPLYSQTCGSAVALPNGNILITESDNGRALEVTRDQQVVWEFHNPARAGDDDEFIATLFEVTRLPPDFPTHWMTPGK